jgi:hypothetical protein
MPSSSSRNRRARRGSTRSFKRRLDREPARRRTRTAASKLRIKRRNSDYVRYGTNLYAALDVASGQVVEQMTSRHRVEELRRFLNLIDKSVPAHLDV